MIQRKLAKMSQKSGSTYSSSEQYIGRLYVLRNFKGRRLASVLKIRDASARSGRRRNGEESGPEGGVSEYANIGLAREVFI